jgi:signal peptidase I
VADIVPFTPPAEDPGADDDSDVAARGRHRRGGKPSGKKKGKYLGGSLWLEIPILIGTALVLTFLIQTFLARVYVIPSQSMEQTLHGCPDCTNDRVLVDKVTYRFGDPGPGDVVVFRGPESWGSNPEVGSSDTNIVTRTFHQFGALFGLAPPDERDFVKRVIATGGQTVQCCDDHNRVIVDGKALDEPYLYFGLGAGNAQEPFKPVTVPDGHLWVMGDNRNNSSDSRRHIDDTSTGTIPVANVIGKARAIVLPPSRWGGVSDHNPQAVALGAAAWQSGLPAAAGVLLAGGAGLAVRRRRHCRQFRCRRRR